MTAVTDKLRANEWEEYEGRMKSDITSEFTFRARKRRIHVISLSSNELWTGDSRLRLSSRPNRARYMSFHVRFMLMIGHLRKGLQPDYGNSP